jgi:hypothetical protein
MTSFSATACVNFNWRKGNPPIAVKEGFAGKGRPSLRQREREGKLLIVPQAKRAIGSAI